MLKRYKVQGIGSRSDSIDTEVFAETVEEALRVAFLGYDSAESVEIEELTDA
jgi:hypothetical protein